MISCESVIRSRACAELSLEPRARVALLVHLQLNHSMDGLCSKKVSSKSRYTFSKSTIIRVHSSLKHLETSFLRTILLEYNIFDRIFRLYFDAKLDHVYFVPIMMTRCLVRMIVSWLYLYVFLIMPLSRRRIAACFVLGFSSRFPFSAGFIEPPRYRFERRRAPAIARSYRNHNFSEYYFVSHRGNIIEILISCEYNLCAFLFSVNFSWIAFKLFRSPADHFYSFIKYCFIKLLIYRIFLFNHLIWYKCNKNIFNTLK